MSAPEPHGDLEDRLRMALRRPDRTTVSPGAWPSVQRRLRRRRGAAVPVLVTACAVLALLALAPLSRLLPVGRGGAGQPLAPPPAAGGAAEVGEVSRVADPAAAARALGRSLPGTPVAAVAWTDRGGRNLIVLSSRAQAGSPSWLTDPPSPTRTVRLYADHFRTAGGATVLVRAVRDGVEDCELDPGAAFRPGSPQVSDADHDGLGEVVFAYTLGCRAGAGADDFKLLLLEDGAKYIVRGQSYPDARAASGQPKLAAGRPEPAFSAWPPALRSLVEARYRAWAFVG